MPKPTPDALPADRPATTPPLPRRGFLARAGLGLLATVAATRSSAQQPAWQAGPTQDAWLARLTGTHRQLFDTPTLEGGGSLSQVRNFLNAYRDAYGLGDTDVNAVVGVHGRAVPLVFDDRTWRRFGFGATYQVEDPETQSPARRNVFRAGPGGPLPPEATVEALQRRGVIFLLCDNSLRRVSGTLSAAGHGTPESVREALIGGLLPGVELVPAMVVAMNLAQEKGVTYVYAG